MTQIARAVNETIEQILASLDESTALGTKPADSLRETITAQALSLCANDRSLIVDPQSERLLGFSSAVLATYHLLSELTENSQEARRLVGDALVRTAEEGSTTYIEARLGIRLDEPESAFDRIANCFIERGESRFGSAFRYAQDVLDEERCFVRIEKCFFDSFFRTHQAEDLTPLLCRLDIVWTEELHRRCSTVAFSRPTTLAAGDDACRFQFVRVNTERS